MPSWYMGISSDDGLQQPNCYNDGLEAFIRCYGLCMGDVLLPSALHSVSHLSQVGCRGHDLRVLIALRRL
jgi:hypothetical protein